MTPRKRGTWRVTGTTEWRLRYYLYEVEVFVPETGKVDTNCTSATSARATAQFLLETAASTSHSRKLLPAECAQGEKTSFEVNGRKVELNTGQRLADNLADVELIKIDSPGVHPLAVWDPLNKVFVRVALPRKSSLAQEYKKAEPDWFDASYATRMPIPPAIRGTAAEKRLKSWKKKKPVSGDSTYTQTLAQEGALVSDAAGLDFQLDVRIQPGQSGSPMMGNLPLGVLSKDVLQDEHHRPMNAGIIIPSGEVEVLLGIAKSYERDFEHSHAVSAERIADLVERYKNGERGNGGVRWRLRKGLTYRDLGDGTLEINPRNRPAGHGTGGDGGNGTGDVPDESSADAFDKYDLSVGMQWKNQAVIGFEVDGRTYMGNVTNLQYLKSRFADGSIRPISANEEIGDLIRKKGKRSVDSWGRGGPHCRIEYGADGKGDFTIEVQVSNGRTLKLVLDPAGKVKGSKEFRPIVELPGKKDSYKIDVSGLFSIDLSTLAGNSILSSLYDPAKGIAASDSAIRRFGDEPYVTIKGADSSGESRDVPLLCKVSIVEAAHGNCSTCSATSSKTADSMENLIRAISGI